MVSRIRPLLVFVTWWLYFHQCCALANGMLSWRFENRSKTSIPDQLMECETLSISLSPKTSNPSGREISYFILAVGPGGNATMTLVGHEPTSLRWTVQHLAGNQLHVALLDTLGTSFGVLPAVYTVIPGSTDCVANSQSPGALDETRPKISSSTFVRLIPCNPWEQFVFGEYSVSLMALGSGNVYSCSVPFGEYIHSFMSGEEYPAQATARLASLCIDLSPWLIVIVSDANGMRDAMNPINDMADAADTPSSGTLATLSSCRPVQPSDLPSYSHRPQRRTAFKSLRSFPDHPHMQLSRDLATINSSSTDTVAVAVCVSLGGTGLVAAIIYAIMKYRLHQKHLDAQDTLPRPFEITVPAANTSPITHGLTSVPVLDISPRAHSRRQGRGRSEAPHKEEVSLRIEPLRAGSTPITTTPPQSQPSLSRNTRTRTYLSDATVVSNHAGPSFHRSRSLHTPIPPDPQSHSGSRVQSDQSPSSLPTTQPRRAVGVSATRSATVRERRSAKHALWLSRSASELYRASSSVPHYRTPESGTHASSGRYTHHRLDEHELHVASDTSVRPTNHLRQWHSASPVVRLEDSREDLGRTAVFQHQDAGVMQELPPPYHKLVRSDVRV